MYLWPLSLPSLHDRRAPHENKDGTARALQLLCKVILTLCLQTREPGTPANGAKGSVAKHPLELFPGSGIIISPALLMWTVLACLDCRDRSINFALVLQ